MILIKFQDWIKEIPEELLNENEFDVDFYGEMMIKFEKRNGEARAINGVNGYGQNTKSEIFDQKAELCRSFNWL